MKALTSNSKSDFVTWVKTLAVFMLNMQVGFIYGWTSPNVAWLLSPKSTIPTTPDDISWMMAIATLGAPVGSVVGSILIEYLGTRKTVLAAYLISAVSWMCILFANSIEWLYAATFISALPGSMSFSLLLYLSEVTIPTKRGTLISLAMIGFPLGVLLGITAETYLPKSTTSPTYLTEALVGFGIFCWLKDTPYILAKKGDVDGAKKSIEFYLRNADASKELEAVRLFVENSEGIGNKLKKFRSSTVRKSMFVVCLVFCLRVLSGGAIVMSYTEVIITKAKVDLIQPAQCVIYMNIITIIVSFLTFKLPDKLGRRLLLAFSSIGTVVSLTSLGLHFYLLEMCFDAKTLQWLAMTSMVAYSISFTIGYNLIPDILLSEMFPENIKSVAACAVTMFTSLFAFVVLKAYQPIVNTFGDAWAFWIFAVLSAMGIPIALFLMIETKGKSFQQIQDKLVTKKT